MGERRRNPGCLGYRTFPELDTGTPNHRGFVSFLPPDATGWYSRSTSLDSDVNLFEGRESSPSEPCGHPPSSPTRDVTLVRVRTCRT